MGKSARRRQAISATTTACLDGRRERIEREMLHETSLRWQALGRRAIEALQMLAAYSAVPTNAIAPMAILRATTARAGR